MNENLHNITTGRRRLLLYDLFHVDRIYIIDPLSYTTTTEMIDEAAMDQ